MSKVGVLDPAATWNFTSHRERVRDQYLLTIKDTNYTTTKHFNYPNYKKY